jgi:hypothetical protein
MSRVSYCRRAALSPIMFFGREMPAQGLCCEFWHGTGEGERGEGGHRVYRGCPAPHYAREAECLPVPAGTGRQHQLRLLSELAEPQTNSARHPCCQHTDRPRRGFMVFLGSRVSAVLYCARGHDAELAIPSSIQPCPRGWPALRRSALRVP